MTEEARLLTEIRDLMATLVTKMTSEPAKRTPKAAAKSRAPVPYWQEMVKHVDEAWKRKKGSAYPFTPRDFAQLKNISNVYMAWGVMALWDYFLASDDPFYRQTGYKIGAFVQSLPKLLDMDWKTKADGYRRKLEPQDQSIAGIIAGLSNAKALSI